MSEVIETVVVDQQKEKNEREVDKEYLALLERKLKSVKNPSGKKATAKQFISDIASVKDHQLFNLLTSESTDNNKFDDDFVDQVIQPSLIQRKLAPQTCAVAASEKLKLVRNDHVQRVKDQLEEEGEEKKGEDEIEEAEEVKEKTEEVEEGVKVVPEGEWAHFEEESGETVEKSKKE